jgi:nitrite reductase/ring-hydroxylating ferredoxin subunit/uncharacterized membrane protein
MKPIARETVVERLEQLELLDAPSEQVKGAVDALVPEGSALKGLLSGTWLGHPVHPPLTDVVVGSWTSAFVLDAIGGTRSRPASDLLVATGIAAAVPTAASGLSDWADTRGGTRRVGTVHAIANSAALVLHGLSLAARRRGSRRRGVALSWLGLGVAMASAWLGGHLSFAKGVGVDQTVFERYPESWTPVADETDVTEGLLVGAEADGVGVLLVRDGGRLHALGDRCTHRGCSLSGGTFARGEVTCPCHGSTFRLDGSIVRGPATAPQPVLDVRASDGRVEIRRASA